MLLASVVLGLAIATSPASKLEESQVPGQFDHFVISAGIKDQGGATTIDKEELAAHLREVLRKCNISAVDGFGPPRTALLSTSITAVPLNGFKGYALMWTLTLSSDTTLPTGDVAFAGLWQRTGVLAGPFGPSAWNELRAALDSAVDAFCKNYLESRTAVPRKPGK